MQPWPDLFTKRHPTVTLGQSSFELTQRINRLRIRSEQMLIHLKTLGKDSRDADEARQTLSEMIRELSSLKQQRRKSRPWWIKSR